MIVLVDDPVDLCIIRRVNNSPVGIIFELSDRFLDSLVKWDDSLIIRDKAFNFAVVENDTPAFVTPQWTHVFGSLFNNKICRNMA